MCIIQEVEFMVKYIESQVHSLYSFRYHNVVRENLSLA
jgi:hypothetical protein